MTEAKSQKWRKLREDRVTNAAKIMILEYFKNFGIHFGLSVLQNSEFNLAVGLK